MTDVRDEVATAAPTEKSANPPGSFIWYELITPDPGAAKAFYDRVVGWAVDVDQVAPDVDYRMIKRADGGNAGGVLTLTQDMREHGAKPMWMGYVGVDDVDAAMAAVEARGGKALMPAWDAPGVGRLAMSADPQGNPMYLMKPLPPAGDANQSSDVFSPDAEQRVAWNELSTADPGAARAFYGELFGWTSDDFMPMGEMGEYRFLDHHGVRFGALCGVMPGGSAAWRYYIRVPSIAAAVEAVKAGGGSVAVGPHEVPGGDHIIIGNDPLGAEFALVGKA